MMLLTYPKEPELGAGLHSGTSFVLFFKGFPFSISRSHDPTRCQLLMEMMYKRLEPNALAYDLGIDACEAKPSGSLAHELG